MQIWPRLHPNYLQITIKKTFSLTGYWLIKVLFNCCSSANYGCEEKITAETSTIVYEKKKNCNKCHLYGVHVSPRLNRHVWAFFSVPHPYKANKVGFGICESMRIPLLALFSLFSVCFTIKLRPHVNITMCLRWSKCLRITNWKKLYFCRSCVCFWFYRHELFDS